MTERDYVLPFSVFPGIGPGRFQSLLSRFSTVKKAYIASEPDLASIIGKKFASDFVRFREQFDIDTYKQKLAEKHVSFITFFDTEYPQKLKDLQNPPFALYVKGKEQILKQSNDDKVVGIVGTRKITSYGKQITEQFSNELIRYGCIIVSGLALGVDATAHKATVENNGLAIAVLGCGVDCCYPSSNSRLYERILETDGTVISEYPLSASPNKGSFPSRNRIIAALSDGLLVTEGAEDSGSLITAEYALKLNRKVFAIPGPVTSSLSRGPLKLIRKGARLVTSGEEILEELGVKKNELVIKKNQIKGDTEEEQKIIDCIANECLTFDEIVKKTGIQASKLGVILSLMEMKDLIMMKQNEFILKNP